MLHRFHSRDWFAHLAKKLPLDDACWARLLAMEPGHALMFASRLRVAACGADHVCEVAVRPRITADRGGSKRNAGTASAGNVGATAAAGSAASAVSSGSAAGASAKAQQHEQ